MYQEDYLREYILKSELRIFNENIKVRLSKELALKYDNGIYDNYLSNIQKCLNMIKTLDFIYPGKANPILYVYIVPDDSYSKLLKVPNIFDKGKGGGKTVGCYDIDGFNFAYGLSQNILENMKNKEMSIARFENEIHELSHIIHSQFYKGCQTISEGFAEALPLYGLDIELEYEEHRNMISTLDEDKILTVQELLNSEKNGTFGKEELIKNKTCSFRLSYISSYLFVRGCIETIIDNFNYTKKQAFQYFLEILKQSNCTNEWLIFDIASAIKVDKEELLNGKSVQINVIKKIKSN